MTDYIVITVPGDIDEIVRQVQQAAAKAGGTMAGDSEGGTFTGKTPLGPIKGTYAIAGHHVTIAISEKPWLIPLSRIEQELRNYFA